MIKGMPSYFLLILMVAAFVLVAQILMPFFAPLILAASFASVLHPLFIRLRKRLDGHGDLAAIGILLVTLLCILFPIALLLTVVIGEAAKLYGSIVDGTFAGTVSTLLLQVQHLLPDNFLGTDYSASVAGNVSVYLREALVWISAHVTDAFSSIAVILLDLFVFFVALFFFLRDGESIRKTIIELSPLPDRDDNTIFDRLGVAVNSVIRGNLFIALVRGILAAIGFAIFGVPNPVLWGIVTGVLGLIPGIGIILVFAPTILYTFFASGWVAAAGLLVWAVFIVGLVDNILAPYLFGHGLQMHPLFVFLSIFGGISYFGPIGIFLGPLSLSFLFALLSIYTVPLRHGKDSEEA